MTSITRGAAAGLAAFALLFAGGCKTDEAAEKDLKNATEDVQDAGKEAGKEADEAADDVGKAADEAGKDAENAAPGDADDDGK